MNRRDISADIFILSQFNLDNYGNRLQSHAVSYLLSSYGLNSITVAPQDNLILRISKDFIKDITPRQIWKEKVRYSRFKHFSEAYAPYKYLTFGECDKLFETSGCIIVGSDQVWSPFFLSYRKDPSFYFLPNLSPDRKIALSPSFGMSDIPQKYYEIYSHGLSTFSRLSAREDAGARIITQFTGNEAEVLIDPTMAVNVIHWRNIANYDFCPNSSYLLIYSLGKLPSYVSNSISKFALSHGLDIIDIMNSKYYMSGPLEFIALIDRATYVVTDSFHGTVFSMLLHTPFCVYNRVDEFNRDMSSRFETIFRLMKCEGCVIDSFTHVLPFVDSSYWKEIDQSIEGEREKLQSYLRDELIRCNIV